jgi:hypothetical protein
MMETTMTQPTLEQLANDIAYIKDEMELCQTEYQGKTALLIQRVGEEGATFETPKGVVQVTQKTLDRTTPDLVVAFDPVKFMALDPANRAAIEELGIVSIKPKVIKGQDPVVRVRLK